MVVLDACMNFECSGLISGCSTHVDSAGPGHVRITTSKQEQTLLMYEKCREHDIQVCKSVPYNHLPFTSLWPWKTFVQHKILSKMGSPGFNFDGETHIPLFGNSFDSEGNFSGCEPTN